MSRINESLDEMHERLTREQKEFENLLSKQRQFFAKTKSALIAEYGSLDKVPDAILQSYKKEERKFEEKWGQKAKRDLEAEHKKAHQDKKQQEQKAATYEEVLRRQKQEFDEFPAKANAHWKQHEEVHDGLAKEYGNWANVPEHLKQAYKKNVDAYDKQWREDGIELAEMIKRHQKELEEHIKEKAKALEEEWARAKQRSKERDR
jgi:hypothetical protein